MAKFEIHVSDLRSFKQCRRKWNWSSMLRMGLEPQRPYAPFFTGRAVHHCLEHYYSNKHVPFEKSLEQFLDIELKHMQESGALWQAERETIDEQIELIRGITSHYKQWVSYTADTPWGDNNLEFIAMEVKFHVPLYSPTGGRSSKVDLGGRFDGLVRRKDNGTYWIWEAKTTRSINELERSLVNDEQAGAYMLAAEQMFNVKVSGVLYNIMRKKIPSKPSVLQNGTLSKNKSIDTTAYAYMDAAVKQHPDWTKQQILIEYEEILDILLNKGNDFFRRVGIYRTANELKQIQKDLWSVGLEMTRSNVAIYPSPSWMNCNFCHFRAPCLAMNAGSDVDLILAQEYQPRQEWETLDVTEESME